MQKRLQKIKPLATALLNGYSLLFFSNNKWFGILLIFVSFFNPYAGLAGLVAAAVSIAMAYFTGLNKALITDGLFSFNAVIIGLGMGTIYNFGVAFWLLLFVIVVFSVILSVLFLNLLGKYNLPFVTLPFVICFWLLVLVAQDLVAINFTYRNVYWINDLYAVGNHNLVRFIMYFENLRIPFSVATFFRALSSLYFQNNILCGMLIALGLLIHSRIIFSLIIVGFITAFFFNTIVLANPGGITSSLVAVNYILVSVAIGGFFTIPSFQTYVWAVFSVPITFIIVLGLGKLIGQWNLPVYTMPFSITTIILLYFFSLKAKAGKIVLTPLQYYSPEKNLYSYLNHKERLANEYKVRLQLPFVGKWMVSQGYDGSITHKGDWSNALDFIIVDEQLKTYTRQGLEPGDFYCFNKPVLAPADGFVQLVEDFIEDNEIGRINKKQNWGNSIVIKHAEGLYTKLSHLKKNSIKVKQHDYVKRGDIIAYSGNSGRSPEPHLHFQVQSFPYIGSKTLAWPLAHFVAEKNGKSHVMEYAVPHETDVVYNVVPNNVLQNAFEFSPGFNLTVTSEYMPTGRWEVFTDAWNNSYIYCHTSNSFAYFKQHETVFYFTTFEGDQNSLLYYFYLACYKIYLSVEPSIFATDNFPLQLNKGRAWQWLQDFAAPFYIFSRLHYQSLTQSGDSDFLDPSFTIVSNITSQFLYKKKNRNHFSIIIKANRIQSFSFQKNRKTNTALCNIREY